MTGGRLLGFQTVHIEYRLSRGAVRQSLGRSLNRVDVPSDQCDTLTEWEENPGLASDQVALELFHHGMIESLVQEYVNDKFEARLQHLACCIFKPDEKADTPTKS